MQVSSFEENQGITPGTRHATPDGDALFGKEGVTFADLIDVVNPLHHIPVVGTVYRWLSGDTITPAARLAGGALFGGPIGIAAAAVANVADASHGRDIGQSLMAWVTGEDAEKPAAEAAGQLAANGAGDADAAAAAVPQQAAAAPAPIVAPAPIAPPAPGSFGGIAAMPPSAAAQPIAARLETPIAPTPAALTAATDAPVPRQVAATQPQSATDGFPLKRNSEGFAAPQRTNNVMPRMPGVVNRAEVTHIAPTLPRAQRFDDVPPTVLPSAPGVGVNDAMARALDKYDSLLRTRRGTGGVDRSL